MSSRVWKPFLRPSEARHLRVAAWGWLEGLVTREELLATLRDAKAKALPRMAGEVQS